MTSLPFVPVSPKLQKVSVRVLCVWFDFLCEYLCLCVGFYECLCLCFYEWVGGGVAFVVGG